MALNLQAERQRIEGGYQSEKVKMIDRNAMNEEVQKYRHRLVQIEESIAVVSSENEGLKKLVEDHRRENEQLKLKIVQINSMHTQNIERMREQFHILIKQYLGHELARVRHYHVKEREKVERELTKRFNENSIIRQDVELLRIENNTLKNSGFIAPSVLHHAPEQTVQTLVINILLSFALYRII